MKKLICLTIMVIFCFVGCGGGGEGGSGGGSHSGFIDSEGGSGEAVSGDESRSGDVVVVDEFYIDDDVPTDWNEAVAFCDNNCFSPVKSFDSGEVRKIDGRYLFCKKGDDKIFTIDFFAIGYANLTALNNNLGFPISKEIWETEKVYQVFEGTERSIVLVYYLSGSNADKYNLKYLDD